MTKKQADISQFAKQQNVQVETSPQIDEQTMDNINYIMNPEFSLLTYGFRFKLICSPSDPRLYITDLWGWLKKICSLKSSKPAQFKILFDLNSYLNENLDHDVIRINNYDMVNGSLEIFEILGWSNKVYGSHKQSIDLSKKLSIPKQDCIKKISIHVLNFQLKTAIELIDKLKIKVEEDDYKEMGFILDMLKLFDDFYSKPTNDFESLEYKIISKCVGSLELTNPYLRLIQIFLSKQFLVKKDVVINLKGVTFFDKFLFVLRYQYKDAKQILDSYLQQGRINSNLDSIVMFSHDDNTVAEILQQYFNKTNDAISVGLASIILLELYNNGELEKFIECMFNVLHSVNDQISAKISKHHVELRKKIAERNKDQAKVSPNLPLICFYCKNDPAKYNKNDPIITSKCKLTSRHLKDRQPRKVRKHLLQLQQQSQLLRDLPLSDFY
jgi:hypothetical protein